ncbi:hypothetical protein PG994_005638 [Apiospora phragmitis]|uniref:Uncharacterized protein n=1 Tax=Apiospora phragmitis TaxID=2905665 RepID=A0ABR1VDT4_9PEZI
MGVASVSVCLYVAFWIRSVQSRVDEMKKNVALAVVGGGDQKEVDVEKAMTNFHWQEEEKLQPRRE